MRSPLVHKFPKQLRRPIREVDWPLLSGGNEKNQHNRYFLKNLIRPTYSRLKLPEFCMLLVFDGIDGGGKTTQINRLKELLQQHRPTIVCKDPGSTKLGEALRAILLNKGDTPIDMRSEMMLFSTARTQLVQEIIKPALAEMQFVILDRYVMSTVVYQGHAGKLNPQDIRDVNNFATDGLKPHHTFVLDIPVDVAMARLGNSLDRMESRGSEYFAAVRSGFLAEAKSEENCTVIDATQSEEQIAKEIESIVNRMIR